MRSPDWSLREEDLRRLHDILERLRRDSNAKLAFLIDRNGQQLGFAGALDGADPTALASLAAGNVAATEGLAKLIGEDAFAVLFHEGEREHLHLSLVGRRAILLVRFDERSSLGLVRLRVRKATAEIEAAFRELEAAAAARHEAEASIFAQITDEDIDALFG